MVPKMHHLLEKAKKWLEEQGESFQLRDIKEDKPNLEELRSWHQASGLPLKKFFNTSGLVYKSMELKDKLPGDVGGGTVGIAGLRRHVGETSNFNYGQGCHHRVPGGSLASFAFIKNKNSHSGYNTRMAVSFLPRNFRNKRLKGCG